MLPMNEQDIIDAIGPPDEVDDETMKAVDWKCSHCGRHYVFDMPVQAPAPCACASIFFETG